MNSEKPERGYDGLEPVTAKCCRTPLPSDKVDVNYIVTPTFLMNQISISSLEKWTYPKKSGHCYVVYIHFVRGQWCGSILVTDFVVTLT